jgi:hypothetical protein
LELEAYHTQEHRDVELKFPIMAEGNDQWLGDGYYFWQDYEFSSWWGQKKKCSFENKSRQFCIFMCILSFDENEFIDTVFNEEDYNNFVITIQKFAKKYRDRFHKKPTLEEFNDFISDFGIWNSIKIIRFQDVPERDEHIEVKGFYYKKRIQIRVNDPEIISKFVHFKTLYCV